MDKPGALNLKLEDYQEKGLYIILPDSSRLVLTKSNIENTAGEFWKDPARIPQYVKEAAEFQRCSFCPLKGIDELCDAIRPIFPFLGIIDKYVSFDEVVAIYKGEEKELLHLADTTMQDALKFVSILSLTQYCQIGRKYYRYYFGVVPIMKPKGMASRLYLNIYWLHKADKESIAKLIKLFIEEMRITAQNQVKRLNLICKNDAFMNAFVNTQVVNEFLQMDIEKTVEASFNEFDQGARIYVKNRRGSDD